MGFLGNLGKGFVRSAVNQVGRDTGRIVSNSIYGNSHATPIRNVNQTSRGDFIDDKGIVIDPAELRERAESDGWEPKYSSHANSYKWFSRIFCFLCWLGLGIISYPFSLALPIVPIIICIAGIRKIFSKKVTWERDGTIYIKQSDRRYKGGYRVESQSGKETVKLPCNKDDRKMLIIHGIADFIIAAILCLGVSHWGGQFYKGMRIDEYKRFLNDSAKIMQDLNFDKEYSPERYKMKVEEFNKKYQEAIEYIKNNSEE